MKNFYKNYFQMFHGIELCLEQKLQFPALSLIYSTIDSLAWIAYGDISVKKRFTKWIDEYMYEEKKLSPSSLDLYSARCAILHTLTPNSDLSNKLEASVIAYAWGNADVSVAEKSIEKSGCKQLIFIHIDDLFESLKLGTCKFINNGNLDNDCLERVNQHYTDLSQNDLENYNNCTYV